MKKRSLSLFLALLMVFGSVLPVFATEPAVEAVAEEQNLTGADAYYALYVPGATFNWMAYHEDAAELEGATDLEGANGAVLSVTPNGSYSAYDETSKKDDGNGYTIYGKVDEVEKDGYAAYENGYLRVVNGTLTASGVYTAEGADKYTTEMIYATYDANRQREYQGANFDQKNIPIFAEKVPDVFTVWGMHEDLSFTDANGKSMQERWAKAYLLANNNQEYREKAWFPISASHYGTLGENGFTDTIREVGGTSGNEPFADYSMTGYEANAATYGTTVGVTWQGEVWRYYYHGFYYVSQQYEGIAETYSWLEGWYPSNAYPVRPGIGNSYVMKSEVAIHGNTVSVPSLTKDFENWGPEKGNWSRYDFGVVTSHTWKESYVDGTYTFTEYGDDVQTNTISAAANLTLKPDFVANGFDADYYAIRVYPFLLDEAQKAQNHFADLANYVKIDNVDAFLELDEDSKQALYAQFAETTFADADKADIEAAIDEMAPVDEEQAEQAKHIAKYEKLADLYVTENLIALWSAYGAKELEDGTLIGVINRGKELTYESNGSYNAYDENGAVVQKEGTAVYGDGYLRLVNGTLTVRDVYPAGINAVTGYTTEMIYASYDANRKRAYQGAQFDQENIPIFAEKVPNVFTVWSMHEDLTFTDAKGKAMQEEWAKNYLLANNNEALWADFWAPISLSHYELADRSGLAADSRQVGGTSGNEPIADYSMTGYEANYSLTKTIFAAKPTFYHGYYYVSQQYEGMPETYTWADGGHIRPGIGNSYVMKSEINRDGAWVANNYVLDFENWGPELGNWSRYDFGVVTSHTWEERIYVDNGPHYGIKTYGDSQTILNVPAWGGSGVGMNTNFVADGFDADYYAIRIYKNGVDPLTDAQKAQNHFVDLISYHDIDIEYVEMFEDLANKTVLYDAFASTMVKDTTKAELESAIAAASLGMSSANLAETYVSFLGYQVKINGNVPGLRAVFNVNKNGSIANVELVEVGAIMAIAGDRTVADLTVAKNGDEYVAVGAQMMNAAVYKNSNWNNIYEHEDGVTTTFSYTCLFNDLVQDTENEQAPADKLQTKLLFRGYAVVKVGDVECVFYTDMTSETFPNATTEGVSMYDLSLVVPGSLSDKVINIVTPPPPSEGEGATEVEG